MAEQKNIVGEESSAHRLFITNIRDARRKQRNIIVLFAFFLLTFLIPQLNVVPSVQVVTRSPETMRTTVTQLMEPSSYAEIFVGDDPSSFRAGIEHVLNPSEMPTILSDNLAEQIARRRIPNVPEWVSDGTIALVAYAVPLILVVQLLLLGLGVFGLVLSYKDKDNERLRGMALLRVAAWSFAGSYLLLMLIFLGFNLAVGYIITFGLPGIALLSLAASLLFIRQVFMFRWFMYPETVISKEVAHLSYYTSQGTKECPHCHANVLETLESCPECGQALVERWKCRECGQVNTASRQLCYSCGHPPRKDPRERTPEEMAALQAAADAASKI
ncbi:MAG: hypothetical protein FWE06_02395 [Oscillospiraceae bacterium]|nr:hypothetical protein [Oscillospiraceae bacterium]